MRNRFVTGVFIVNTKQLSVSFKPEEVKIQIIAKACKALF